MNLTKFNIVQGNVIEVRTIDWLYNGDSAFKVISFLIFGNVIFSFLILFFEFHQFFEVPYLSFGKKRSRLNATFQL